MKIAQVASALPSSILVTPRLAEGAMPFELPTVAGEGGSGECGEASNEDASNADQSVGNGVFEDLSVRVGIVNAEGLTARQLPLLPMARPLPPLTQETPPISGDAPASAGKADAQSAGSAMPSCLTARIGPPDRSVQPTAPEIRVDKPVAAGAEVKPDDARRLPVDHIAAPSAAAYRPIAEVAHAHLPVGQDGAAPTLAATGAETAQTDVRIFQPHLKPAVAIIRQMAGDGRTPSPGPPTLPVAEPPPRSAGGNDRVGGPMMWRRGHEDIDAVTAPTQGTPTIDMPILSGMTRSSIAVAATSPASPTAPLPVLEIDADGQWIDRLSAEISACATTGGVRLKLSPDNLGELSIAVSNGESGASVTITAQDEDVLSAIAGAQDRLIAEARANGLRLADVQTGLAGEGGGAAREQMRRSPHGGLSEPYTQPKRTMQTDVANHERANPAGRWA